MRSFKLIATALLAALLALSVAPLYAQTADSILRLQQQAQADAASHQRQIDSLDDATRELFEAYRRELRAEQDQRSRNQELRQLIEARQAALAAQADEQAKLQSLRLELLPLLRAMAATLSRAVAIDRPFLQTERELRSAALEQALAQPRQPLPELLRRTLQAYLIETAYGYEISVERDVLPHGDETATVDLLRLGRLALFYLSLDQSRAGAWDSDARLWRMLGPDDTAAVREAIDIVRRQAPPRLVILPLAPE